MRLEVEPAASQSAGFIGWDELLKMRGLNIGTSADLIVCTLFLAVLLDPQQPVPCDPSGVSGLAIGSTREVDSWNRC